MRIKSTVTLLLVHALLLIGEVPTARAAPLSVVRDPSAPKRCFTYTTRPSDTIASLISQLGLTPSTLLAVNAPLRISNNTRLALKSGTPLRICDVPPGRQAQLQVLNLIYDQMTNDGVPYRRMDTGLTTFWVVPMPVTFNSALGFCRAHGGALASISTRQEERELVSAVVSTMNLNQVEVWVGAKRPANTLRWYWVDKTQGAYSNWAAGCPRLTMAEAACSTLRVVGRNSSSSWYDTPCESINPGFICRFRPQRNVSLALVPAPAPPMRRTTAPTGETVFEFNLTASRDVARAWLVARPMDMPAAEAFCVRNGGHLADIHSARGLDQIRQVSSRLTGYVWLGLLRDADDGYQWTNQSPVNFQPWAKGQPMGLGICTLLCSWSNLAGSGYFIDVPCGLEMMFACRF